MARRACRPRRHSESVSRPIARFRAIARPICGGMSQRRQLRPRGKHNGSNRRVVGFPSAIGHHDREIRQKQRGHEHHPAGRPGGENRRHEAGRADTHRDRVTPIAASDVGASALPCSGDPVDLRHRFPAHRASFRLQWLCGYTLQAFAPTRLSSIEVAGRAGHVLPAGWLR